MPVEEPNTAALGDHRGVHHRDLEVHHPDGLLDKEQPLPGPSTAPSVGSGEGPGVGDADGDALGPLPPISPAPPPKIDGDAVITDAVEGDAAVGVDVVGADVVGAAEAVGAAVHFPKVQNRLAQVRPPTQSQPSGLERPAQLDSASVARRSHAACSSHLRWAGPSACTSLKE